MLPELKKKYRSLTIDTTRVIEKYRSLSIDVPESQKNIVL
jgi:hypothetical protein